MEEVESRGSAMEYRYDRTPQTGELSDYNGRVRFHKVDETKWEIFWDELVNEHHYLGYDGQFGARIKYIITLGRQIVGAISFCSGAYKLGPRDDYIGWDEGTRLSKLQHVLSNNRFLILPWIRIRNLASHILGKVIRQLREDWEKQYEVTPYMIETFVDREKYHGTCYIAANWTYLGITKGYGRQRNTFVYHGHKKDIYVYIMDSAFSREFRPDLKRLRNGREEFEDMINGIPTWTPSILKEMGIKGDVTDQIRQSFAAHLERYRSHLRSKANHKHFIAMEKGFLSDLDRKSIEPIAIAFEGIDSVRSLTKFMGTGKWDDVEMFEEYRCDVSDVLAHDSCMLTLDGTDFPKKGNSSVGVARQYCGRLGKVDNCQASVMAGYAGPHGYALIDCELYMPDFWFEAGHAELRKKCGVPKSLEYKAKNDIASEMIRKASESGHFPAKYLGADSAFGSDSKFLDSLPDGLIYFVDVKSNCMVFTDRPEVIVPPYSGKGKRPTIEKPVFPPLTVKEIALDENLPWNDVVLGIGAKGPIVTNDKLLRVVEVRDKKPGKDVWLYIRKLADGKIKYALCNESPDATAEDLRRPALMRWAIEQCFKECKEYLGMDHYESRSWDGWRRHMLLCVIAHLFIIKLRMEFGCSPKPSDTAPYIDDPVSLDDYLKATESLLSKEDITHPKISAAPCKNQQILTIGLVQRLVSATFVKFGLLLEEIDYQLKTSAQAFDSHSKSTLIGAFSDHYGYVPDFG